MHSNVRSVLKNQFITLVIFLTAAISLIANSDSESMESESAQEWLDRVDPDGQRLPKREPLIKEFEQPAPPKKIYLRLKRQPPHKPGSITCAPRGP